MNKNTMKMVGIAVAVFILGRIGEEFAEEQGMSLTGWISAGGEG